jgi:hypothetical protein
MSESAKWKFGGVAMIVIGLGLILFGGNKSVGGSYFEIFGFRFGHEESEPMSRFESWFWGIALIAGGIFVFKLGG